MGLFKGIGKLFKKHWKGIVKVFKKTMAEVGKFLSSDIGKILMLAVSVFTLGTAFIAAQGAYAAASAAGQSFVSAFIQGGKAFVQTLVGMKAKDAGATTGAQAAAETVAGAAPQAGQLASGVDAAAAATSTATGAAEGALSMGGAIKGAGEAAKPIVSGTMDAVGGVLKQGTDAVNTAANMAGSGATQSGGWLSKAASAAMDFAKSDSGQKLIGSALEGYARADEMQQYKDIAMRGPNSFREGNKDLERLRSQDFNVSVPDGMTAQEIGRQTGNAGRYQQRIPYQQQQQPVGG